MAIPTGLFQTALVPLPSALVQQVSLPLIVVTFPTEVASNGAGDGGALLPPGEGGCGRIGSGLGSEHAGKVPSSGWWGIGTAPQRPLLASKLRGSHKGSLSGAREHAREQQSTRTGCSTQ